MTTTSSAVSHSGRSSVLALNSAATGTSNARRDAGRGIARLHDVAGRRGEHLGVSAASCALASRLQRRPDDQGGKAGGGQAARPAQLGLQQPAQWVPVPGRGAAATGAGCAAEGLQVGRRAAPSVRPEAVRSGRGAARHALCRPGGRHAPAPSRRAGRPRVPECAGRRCWPGHRGRSQARARRQRACVTALPKPNLERNRNHAAADP